MLRQTTRRLRDRTVVTAAILALTGYNVCAADNDTLGGSHTNDRKTDSPIKHVIVIMGENRTFDHVFATYVPGNGQQVDNLLSKRIINIDGTPGPNYAKAAQSAAEDLNFYSNHPGNKTPYTTLQTPGTSYAPPACYGSVIVASLKGPGCLNSLDLVKEALSDDNGLHYSLLGQQDFQLLLGGETGIAMNSPDTRIKDNANLPNGPYPLVTTQGDSLYDTYGGSPVHRFYQMWQQLDCDAAKATPRNPDGCQADLFPWVEETVSSGSNGKPFPSPAPIPLLKEGNIAMGFYNVAKKNDAPYFNQLAHDYTLLDNYHQPVMGGTFANQMMFGYADVLWYADEHGNPATPNHVLVPGSSPAKFVDEVENPNPAPETNNWYTNDGYSGGSYTNCSDPRQPGVASIVGYLNAVHVPPNCAPDHYYLLNNYGPAFIGSGQTDPIHNGPFTLPPVIKQKHIGDVLNDRQVSWAYFGERWNDFKPAPGLGVDPSIAPLAYLYCNICNPFLYSASIMTEADQRDAHLRDTNDLYDAIANGNLPAVSWVKPSTFNDGHPASSKFSIFEAFARKIIEQVKSNPQLWDSTAILVTTDEGGGYYDSGYVQPLDYFGDGTRIPMLVVSKYSRGGRVSHEYTDHASIIKFIERNWELPKISNRSRDNLPNPTTDADNPYVPNNRPALGDLFASFDFAH